jgi:hypothetical protein
MNLHMYCMVKGYHLEIHFLKDRGNVNKFIKSGVERLIFMDYGVSLDADSLYKAAEPFDKYNLLVFPAVKEGINWGRFKSRTLAGTNEPAYQRGLEFDTEVDRKIGDSLYLIKSSDARAWAMDVKAVEKKAKAVIKNKYETAEDFFKALLNFDVKICAFTAAKVTMHFTHECFGNILEAAGVNLENGVPPPAA